MAEIVNLRRVKKARARQEAAQRAAESRARHGMTKAERDAETKRRATEDATLGGAKLADSDAERAQ